MLFELDSEWWRPLVGILKLKIIYLIRGGACQSLLWLLKLTTSSVIAYIMVYDPSHLALLTGKLLHKVT